MSQQIPTTAEIEASIIAKFNAEFGQTVPILQKAFLRVLAPVLAGLLVIAYKFGGFWLLQMFPQYASTKPTRVNGREVVPLVELGRLYGADDPTEAVRAEYSIELDVINPTGSLALNTLFTRAATGVTYMSLAAVDLTAPAPVTVTVRAVADQSGTGGRGVIGNMTAGDTVAFVQPDPRVATTAEVLLEIVAGVDGEDLDTTYRARAVSRFRSQPQGGALIDYRFWGVPVEGIIQGYIYKGDPGQVDVYSEAELTELNPDGIPTAGQLAAVYDAIQFDVSGLASRRPVGAFVNSYAITRTGFDVTITNLSVPGDISVVSDAIEDTLTKFFLSREPYITGISLGSRRDRITQTAVGGAVQDVVDAYGGTFTRVAFNEIGQPEALIYVLGVGEKAKLGTVTYVPALEV